MTLHHNPLPEEGSEVVSKAAIFVAFIFFSGLYISLSFFTLQLIILSLHAIYSQCLKITKIVSFEFSTFENER